MPRPFRSLAAAPLRARHWRALLNLLRRCPQWPAVLRAYLTGRGTFPMNVEVRTPIGAQTVTLHTSHDVLTLNEVFFREDYPADETTHVVVDIGANIGIATLWFLTRNPSCLCYAYEPVAANVAKLRETLRGLEDRYRLEEAAVADVDGTVLFGVEPTGRYGGIAVTGEERIEVRCRHVDDVVRGILDEHGRIDIVKVDTEGNEAAILEALSPESLAGIDAVYAEDVGTSALSEERYERVVEGAVTRYRARRA